MFYHFIILFSRGFVFTLLAKRGVHFAIGTSASRSVAKPHSPTSAREDLRFKSTQLSFGNLDIHSVFIKLLGHTSQTSSFRRIAVFSFFIPSLCLGLSEAILCSKEGFNTVYIDRPGHVAGSTITYVRRRNGNVRRLHRWYSWRRHR